MGGSTYAAGTGQSYWSDGEATEHAFLRSKRCRARALATELHDAKRPGNVLGSFGISPAARPLAWKRRSHQAPSRFLPKAASAQNTATPAQMKAKETSTQKVTGS